MRFLYKILLGAIIFNSMLVLFSAYFISSPVSETAINVSSDSAYEDYDLSSGNVATMTGLSLTVAGITFTFGAIMSWWIKSPVPIGVGVFSSILALFAAPAAIIWTIDPTNNYIVSGIIGTLGIGIAILAAIAVAEMFTQQGGAD